MASIDLGMVTAYAYAVAGGYTGSEQDFEDLLGNIASDLEEIENLSVTVTTLPEGSQATASYNNGVLSLGIPKGDTGATGAEGPEGPTGPTGNGIQSIAKTGTSGNVDTYTITYTNGQTTTFTVTNGSVTSVDGQTGDVDLSNKANIDGYYEDLTAGYAENLISNVYDEENVPYNFRTAGGSLDIGTFEYDEVVGGSLAVNQLVNTGATSVTVQSGHKYFSNINNVKTIGASTGTAISINDASKDNVIDLTLLFGSTIADYIYTLEQGNAGAGVAWLKAHFPKIFDSGYIPYNAGTLEHVSGLSAHKMTGFNQWDEEWLNGYHNSSTGVFVSNANYICSKNLIRVLPSTTYYFNTNGEQWEIYEYDASGNYLRLLRSAIVDSTFVTDADTHFIHIGSHNQTTTYNHNICINLHWDGERDGEYEAYTEHTYPLDSDLVLRGIPKLDSANKLYYDGDTYEADGTVTRRYGIVDMGTLNWFYETNNQVFYAEISDIYARTSGTPNYAINAKYADENVWLASALTDKKFFIRGDIKRIYVKDTAYSTSASFKSSVSNVYLVYLLATPTTETADAFQSPQSVSNWGTEEYIDTRSIPIPVGHNTKYPPDLKAKLETSPNPPDADGDYIVRQTNGVNEYVALSTNATIQNIISRLEALEG